MTLKERKPQMETTLVVYFPMPFTQIQILIPNVPFNWAIIYFAIKLSSSGWAGGLFQMGIRNMYIDQNMILKTVSQIKQSINSKYNLYNMKPC